MCDNSNDLPPELAPPRNCPFCGTKVEIDGAFPTCPNFSCSQRVYGRLRKFVETLDIKGAGEELLKQLVEAGHAKTPGDLYEIKEADFTKLTRQGEKGYKKFIEGLKARSEITVAEFFASLDIEGNGTFEAITAVPGLESYEGIMGAAFSEDVSLFAKAARVSPERAKNIIKQLNTRREEFGKLLKHTTFKTLGTKLHGLNFCITGSLSKPRSQIEATLKEAGAQVSSDVSKHTTHLVCNETDSTSSKMKKAKAKGVPVITEAQLYAML